MEAHVQKMLTLDGHLDSGRVSRHARADRCPRCNARTLAGVAGVRGRVDVDPTPTTPLGEAVAILTGRDTYIVLFGELHLRDRWRIAHKDADAEPVYATHDCHAPPLPANHQHRPGCTTRPDYNAEPPF